MKEKQMLLGSGEKVMVICDYREKEVSGALKKIGLIVNEMALECGDFICSKRVAIERKSYDDFISSIVDGRIFEQASELKKNFEKPIILIEGYSTREINENSLKAAIASLLIDFGISLISTRNQLDTAKTIYWIAKKEQEEKKFALAFKIGKKPEDGKKIKEFIVSSIPGISTVLSKRLLEKFGSVEKVFSASEEELKSVKGIGKKLAKKIKKILSEKYEVKT
ncbi:MAG: ERCC4 domain-containing protein [Candidatus Aenigmatarchaeota archaeon]